MSTLSEIREELVRQTGRYDLVVDTTDYADDGADFYIKNGQRYLDRQINTPKSDARYQEDVSSGNFMIKLEYMRALEQAWAVQDGVRQELEEKPLEWIQEQYPKQYDNVETGIPTYYSPAVIRLSPGQSDVSSGDYENVFTYDSESVVFDNHYSYNGIIFMPPADGTYTIKLIGKFMSEPLENDSDKSYWSVNHPNLLIYAAMYQIEKFYRNTQGMKDMKVAIDDELRGISNDRIQQESAGVNSMNRSEL